MELISQILTSTVAASIVLFALGMLWGIRAAQLERRARQETKEKIAAIQADLIMSHPETAKEALTFTPIVLSTSAAQAPSGYLSSESSIADLRRQIFDINNRIEKQRNEIVEVQRIDPVLEATLKAAIENLTRRIEGVEKNQLTKWDAAAVMLQLLGGIGMIVGATFAIMRYLSR